MPASRLCANALRTGVMGHGAGIRGLDASNSDGTVRHRTDTLRDIRYGHNRILVGSGTTR
jgi:hypothetical protein